MNKHLDYIGLNVKKARLAAGMTQEDLAREAEISSSIVSRLETGRTMVSVERLAEFALILDVHIQDFFVEDEQ